MGSWLACTDDRTVASTFAAAADRWDVRPFLRFEDELVRYGQAYERSTDLAAGFAELGLGRGDAVAVHLDNSAEFLYTWMAASMLGAMTVPINVHLKGAFLDRQLQVARPRVVVTADAPQLRSSLRTVGLLDTRVVVVDRGPRSARSEAPTVDALIEAHAGAELAHQGSWADPNLVMFTSGTTGEPKAAVASNRYVLQCSQTMAEMREPTAEDVFWSPLPMYHANPLFQTIIGPMLFGAQGALDRKFSVSRFWERVAAVGATQLSVLGTMIQLLWNRPPRSDDAVNPARCMLGAPMPAEIHHAFEDRFGLRFVTCYGLSEAHPLVISTSSEPPPPGRVGRPHESFDVMLVDEHDQEVPVGQVGEFVCRPRSASVMFDGYLNNPEATTAMTRNLWFHTGDYGRVDADGWYEFVDRKKDYIRRRGENISSWEVEQSVSQHPDVLEVAAYAISSDLSEDDVMVAVVKRDASDLTESGLARYCQEAMPFFAVPRFIRFVDELPTNALGKVQKQELRAHGTARAWDRGDGSDRTELG